MEVQLLGTYTFYYEVQRMSALVALGVKLVKDVLLLLSQMIPEMTGKSDALQPLMVEWKKQTVT